MNGFYLELFHRFNDIMIFGDNAVLNSAFVLGYLSVTNIPKDPIEHPLTSMVNGVLFGGVFAFGASLVKLIVPKAMYPYIAASCLLSGAWWQIQIKKNPKLLENFRRENRIEL